MGGFGITAADDLLYIEDVQLVRQVCTGASVAFEDQAVADFFDRQVDLGRHVSCFARIWLHTHPGNFAEPSQVDEATFARVFGRTDWAMMFILACQGQSYARLRFNVGPGGAMTIPVTVDYSRPFAASDHAAWKEQYAANVRCEASRFWENRTTLPDRGNERDFFEPFGADGDGRDWWPDLFDEMPSDMEVPHGNHA